MFKNLLLLSGVFALAAQAVEVPGKIFYKLPNNGEMAKRAVTIDVPARGQGVVTLKGEGFEWKTTRFRTYNQDGRQVFQAAFPVKFEDAEGNKKKKVVMFEGTYLRSSDKVLYYGDFYIKKKDMPKPMHGGGFFFKYDRE